MAVAVAARVTSMARVNLGTSLLLEDMNQNRRQTACRSTAYPMALAVLRLVDTAVAVVTGLVPKGRSCHVRLMVRVVRWYGSYRLGRGCGESDDGHVREGLLEVAELGVVGPEVVPPRRHAMSFVDHEAS